MRSPLPITIILACTLSLTGCVNQFPNDTSSVTKTYTYGPWQNLDIDHPLTNPNPGGNSNDYARTLRSHVLDAHDTMQVRLTEGKPIDPLLERHTYPDGTNTIDSESSDPNSGELDITGYDDIHGYQFRYVAESGTYQERTGH